MPCLRVPCICYCTPSHTQVSGNTYADPRTDMARARRVLAASGITSTLAWTLLNSGIALIGYYFSAWLIDDINWGRYRIQVSLLRLAVFAACSRAVYAEITALNFTNFELPGHRRCPPAHVHFDKYHA